MLSFVGAGRALLPSLLVTVISACGPRATTDSDAGDVDAHPLDAPEAADLILDHDALDFGWVCPGMGGEASVRIVNAGDVASSGVEASLVGPHAGLFEIRASSCDSLVAPRSFCEVLVGFRPVEVFTEIDATLELSAREGAWSLPLTGEVPHCESRFTISPTPYAFPETEPGARSEVVFFTITNHAGFRSLPLTVGLSGLDRAEFQLSSSGDTCSGRSIPGLGTCTVGVVYAPSRRGVHQGQLQAQQAGDYVEAALQGRARSAAGLVFTGASTDFGTDCEPVRGDIELWNESDTATGPIVSTLEGGDAGAFSLVSDACAAGLAPDARCVVTLELIDGLAPGSYATTLRASWSGGAIDHPLTGSRTACASAAILEPTNYDFGTRAVGDVSMPLRFTLLNASGSSRGPFTVVLRGGTATEFELSSNTCAGAGLAPSARCTFDVTFAPTTLGAASTVIEVDDGRGRTTAAVQGRGI